MKKTIFALIVLLPLATVFGKVTISLEGGISGLTSNAVIDINHTSDSTIWMGTGGGASVTLDAGGSWETFATESGLPQEEVSALAANSKGVWVGNSHSETVNNENVPWGDGISLSTDNGSTWTTFRPFAYRYPTFSASPGMLSYDLAVYDSIVYSASFYGGLIRSTDYGESWGNLFPSQLNPVNTDSLDFYNNQFNSLANRMFAVSVDTTSFPDTLNVWAGSAAGIIRFSFANSGSGFDTYPAKIDRAYRTDAPKYWDEYDWHQSFLSGGTAAKVSGGSIAQENDDWMYTSVVSFSNASACSLFFSQLYIDRDSIFTDSALVLISDDGGQVWAETLAVFTDSTYGDSAAVDSQVIDISAFAAGKSSIIVAFNYVKRGYEPADSAGIWIIDDIRLTGDGAVLLEQDFEGAWGPYGNIPPSGWIFLDNDYEAQLPGNFVVSINANLHQGQKTLWAACRPAFSGGLRVAYSLDEGRTWRTADLIDRDGQDDIEAWDFSFSNDTVYVASSNGLFWSYGDYTEWDYVRSFADPLDQTYFDEYGEFFTVDVVGADVWAGGIDGTVKGRPGNWEVFRSMIDAAEHFAYPSPFSPIHSARRGTTIHFRPDTDTRATIRIYDINMELVKTVVSDIQRQGGVESDDIIWDGTNGDGDFAANGVYFYKIELNPGGELWGKVVLIR